ncbi:hypothetical protein FHT05_003948 [Xanthomonas arboricola]|uniref:Abi family protein n=1 Tax=Xanthomonas TaxID=338 RepID=UPI001610733E|nr:Abi family protein [Xanthomonas arboricola]CAD7721803.1 hypothetical protein LMG31884_33610 [Xanthomonas hydrangeae]MBB6259309.1 hypothetical protein [Xanthomonas arboricola]CAD7721807.1 hypothetical protein LMG31884_33610 [Xanthomonas hydrangeae]CAD7738599.1 hypothetical protein LMG31887_33510 [Xanthomonas hydrangeae]CAD7738602.1 hypothetical protein LMG31887_33510 [Xanthomonas hydrangeae]
MSHENFEAALSLERFGRYLAWANGDRIKAIALYTLNTQLSESLYTPLQTLEVALRNRVHTVLAEAIGQYWFEAETGVLKGPYQDQQVAQAKAELLTGGKHVSAGGVVAGLTFSFWTTMFNKDYEILWQQILHRIADTNAPKGLKRKSFSGPLSSIRQLRNRIAHHEPILAWDLHKKHQQMLEMISWLSPPAAAWCAENDRFPSICPPSRLILGTGGPVNDV